MLLSDGCDDAEVGVDQTADVGDIADMSRPHFAQKDLMRGQQTFADGAGDAQRGVVIARRHVNMPVRRQKGVQIMLGAGFSVASRDADDRQAGYALHNGARLVNVFLRNAALDRRVERVAPGGQPRRQTGVQAERKKAQRRPKDTILQTDSQQKLPRKNEAETL